MTSAVSARDVSKSFNGDTVISNVTFDVPVGTIIGVNGQVSVLGGGHRRSSLVAIKSPRVSGLLFGV